jgi:UDP-glucose 4-epimerase
VPFEFGSRRSGDPARLFADATAALRTIGFSTGELSALDSIVRTAWSWFEKVHRFDFAPPAVANEA